MPINFISPFQVQNNILKQIEEIKYKKKHHIYEIIIENKIKRDIQKKYEIIFGMGLFNTIFDKFNMILTGSTNIFKCKTSKKYKLILQFQLIYQE